MIRSVMSKATTAEDAPIQHGMITRSLETAQKRIEGFNFDSRKRVLAFDDVLNHQRQAIYKVRRKYLEADRAAIDEFLSDCATREAGFAETVATRKSAVGDDEFYGAVRRLLLQTIDFFWLEHLEVMEHLRSSVNLRAYGQRDPLVEYRKEGLHMFHALEAGIRARVIEAVPQLGAGAFATEQERMKRDAELAQRAVPSGESAAPAPTRSDHAYGRNDVVRVTNGTETREMKYKKAEPLLTQGWKVVA